MTGESSDPVTSPKLRARRESAPEIISNMAPYFNSDALLVSLRRFMRSYDWHGRTNRTSIPVFSRSWHAAPVLAPRIEPPGLSIPRYKDLTLTREAAS